MLAEFGKAGVDVDALGAQLQEEGAKSFVDSWNELMKVIESKSAVVAQGAKLKSRDPEGEEFSRWRDVLRSSASFFL